MRKILALAAPLAVLSGCASTSATSEPAATPPNLAGTTWRFTMIDGAAPVAEQTSLSFERDRLGANVGCNGMGGDWRLEGDRLIATQLMQTQMYCDGPVWGQERAVSQLISSRPLVRRTGDRLSLRVDGHWAELVRTAR